MNILVTNDDGILAPGLALLADVCREVGNVTVVAPDREQSGTSHSLTLHRPLRPARRPDGAWQIDGTPTDCAMLAIQALMPERPDFVFSGVNHGPNMGEDVLYSGTVAAAMEAVTLGVPGIGISFSGNQPETMGTYRDLLLQLVRRIVGSPISRADPAQHQPSQGPRLRGARHPGDQAGQPLLLGVPDPDEGSLGPGDLLDRRRHDHLDRHRELRSSRRGGGVISVTPLHMDLTNYSLLETVRGWSLEG